MTSRRIKEELNCSLCSYSFKERLPKVLPCQHTYCAVCLERLNVRGNVSCPECRRVHTVPADGFPISITIQRLLSAFEMPNVPTITEPVNVSEIRRPIQPTAPPLDPSPRNAPSHRGQTEHPPVYVSQPQSVPNIRTHTEMNLHPSTVSCQAARVTETENTSENGNIFDQCRTTFLKYFKIVRAGVRKVISHFLRKYTKFMAGTTAVFLVITFSRFVAGAVELTSDCPKERRVAEYLFVKAWLGFFFWGMLMFLGFKKRYIENMDNRFVEVCVFIDSLFALIWLIIGTVWTIGFRDEMIDECPFNVDKWNTHFINFARFLTVVDWIGIVAFGFYCCFVKFDNSVDVGTLDLEGL